MSQDLARNAPTGADPASRPERGTVLGFLADALTEQVVRDGLSEIIQSGLELRRGDIRAATAVLAKQPTPETLIVDLSGEAEPLRALDELFGVVEPGVRVLAIGETDDVDFYRLVTRDLGVAEYIFKPVTREAVARYFAPLITRKAIRDETTRGGRVVAITGARGGVGATTIAANLAWYLGVLAKRHTVLLDTDVHFGSAVLLLGGRAGPGLRTILEKPEHIDGSLVTVAVEPISERLHLLAAEERPEDPPKYSAGAASWLIEALRARYNFIVVDLPFTAAPFNRELLNLVHHRVIVMDPTLAAMRDCLRLLALPKSPWQPQTPTLVLNRDGRAGAMTRKQITDALKVKPDIVCPDLPKLFTENAPDNVPPVNRRGPFRQVIAELAREVGFVAAKDQAVPPVRDARLGHFFGRLAPRRG